jgi:hypothetical protein
MGTRFRLFRDGFPKQRTRNITSRGRAGGNAARESPHFETAPRKSSGPGFRSISKFEGWDTVALLLLLYAHFLDFITDSEGAGKEIWSVAPPRESVKLPQSVEEPLS